MAILQKTPRRRITRFLLGGVLCILVFFFSVVAKMAMSQPGKAMNPIASLKLKQKSPEPTLQTASQIAPSVAILFFASVAVFFILASAKLRLMIEELEPTLRCWFTPYLSVRPPPSI
jgi:hypothetical protein